MNKAKYFLVAVLTCLLLAGCNKAEKLVQYTFDDQAAQVKFTITYPEQWKLTEQMSWEGDSTRDASPTTGIQFSFSEKEGETEIFNIGAMRFAPVGIPESPYQAQEFITDKGLKGTKASLEGDTVSVFYVLGTELDSLPQYFGVVNMSVEQYKKYEKEIEQVMKSFVLETTE